MLLSAPQPDSKLTSTLEAADDLDQKLESQAGTRQSSR